MSRVTGKKKNKARITELTTCCIWVPGDITQQLWQHFEEQFDALHLLCIWKWIACQTRIYQKHYFYFDIESESRSSLS